MKSIFLQTLFVSASLVTSQEPSSVQVKVGNDVGWTDGLCYRPISNVRPGDTLLFEFGGHDVVKLDTEQNLEACDFSNGVTVAQMGSAPFEYVITEQDAENGRIFFACSIGAHCSQGLQRLIVNVDMNSDNERPSTPASEYIVGMSETGCSLFQGGTTNAGEGNDFLISNALSSECTDPVRGEDNSYQVSCLSGPITLTPGGVINSARAMHYPFPTDRRVVVGTRTWEFVSGDPIPNSGGMGVEPVPVNQLYVHHLSGSVVLGQGSEGIRRSDVDMPYVSPYGLLSGDEGELTIFHLIDLREVDEWLECVECRCRDPIDGTYLNIGGSDDSLVGGVNCCSNCTDLAGPNIDYRMRYNVSYSDVADEPVTNVQMITADISPVLGKALEFDVPMFTALKPQNQKEGNPQIQRLVRTGAFNELFKMDFFNGEYSGPETVSLLRCVGHLHIAALGMWLEDAETGEIICAGEVTYGDSEGDKGFLTAISVESFDDPIVFPASRQVRLVSEYNATEVHTGVMGMWFLFISSENGVSKEAASLTVDFCEDEVCDVFKLPVSPSSKDLEAVCVDTLPDTPACKFGGLCTCEELVASEESTGCGGVLKSDFGDIEVNSLCRKHCDACPKSCGDTLADSEICASTGVCSCEILVPSSQSTGCGGGYLSQLGMVEVNDYCASYCNACPSDKSEENELLNEILKKLEVGVIDQCKFATPECIETLSNLYACGAGQRRTRKIDPQIDSVIREHGQRLAIKHAKLGSPSLHKNEVPINVQRCTTETSESTSEFVENTENESTKIGPIIGMVGAAAIVLFLAYKLVLETRSDGKKEDQGRTDHCDTDSDEFRDTV